MVINPPPSDREGQAGIITMASWHEDRCLAPDKIATRNGKQYFTRREKWISFGLP
jgi:hypothetical protein